MQFQDKILKCIDCGTDFVFTAGEQLFFHDKQFKNEPKRCKNCKNQRMQAMGAKPANSHAKVETRTTCSNCSMAWRSVAAFSLGEPLPCVSPSERR